MTEWILECKICGNKKIVDLGYNLLEFREVHLYCKYCGRNTAHKVLSFKDENN